MNEADEASYYEIALTNRQVVVAFIILLVCMLASFFAGLWAGRGGTLAGPADPAEMMAEQTEPEDPGLEEFTFFSEEEEPSPDLEELADDPNPDTTLAQDLGREEAPPPPAQPPPQRRPPPTVAEQPSAETNPAIPRDTARRPPPPASEGDIVIQVFSSHEVRQARKVLRQLMDSGYGAFMSPVEVDNATMYRVRLGPFADRASAEKKASEVRSRFKLDTWITTG